MPEDGDDARTLRSQAREAILKRIAEVVPSAAPLSVLQLAEAYAWVISSSQSHGGRTDS